MNNSQLSGLIKSARHPLAILSVSVLASACITAEEVSQRQASRMPSPAEVEQYNASVSPDERIVCRNEIPVGSNIPVRKCRLMIDIDETSTFHREQLRRALR